MTESISREELLALTSEIVSSYVSNNTMPSSEIPGVIEQVFKTLSNVDKETGIHADRPKPAVPIKKSIMPDYIVCLEDGKKLKKGDTADFKVIEFNKEFKRVVASHTAIFREEEEKAAKAVETNVSSSNNVEKSTLGDIDALAELKAKMEKGEK